MVSFGRMLVPAVLVALVSLLATERAAAQFVTVTITADPTTAQPADTIEYTVEIANSGKAPAIGVSMFAPIPTDTSYVAGSANATAPTLVFDAMAQEIRWSGSVPASGMVSIEFQVRVDRDAECSLPIAATATLNDADGTFLDSDSVRVGVPCPEFNVVLNKAKSVATAEPGEIIEYTLTIDNNSADPAIGLSVVDPITTGTSYVAGSLSATAPTVAFNAGANQVEWDGDIAGSGSVTISFRVQAEDIDPCIRTILNEAQLIADATVIDTAHAKVTVQSCPPMPDGGIPDAGLPDGGSLDGGAGGTDGDAGMGGDGGSGCSVGTSESPWSLTWVVLTLGAIVHRRRTVARAPMARAMQRS